MRQPSTNTDRVSFALHSPATGMTVRLRGPAPADPWSAKGHWGDLAGHGLPWTVRVRVEYTPTDDGPAEVAAYALICDEVVNEKAGGQLTRKPTYGVRVQLGPTGPHSVEVHRFDGEALGARDFSQLGLGALYQVLDRTMKDPAAGANLGAEWQAMGVPRPGRRGRDDLEYAMVALDYVRALTEDPDAPLRWMEAHPEDLTHLPRFDGEASADAIRARLRRAREPKRGLLTSAPSGRPGGDLTPKAKQLLGEAGLYEEGDDGER